MKIASISANNLSIGYHHNKNNEENGLYHNLSLKLYEGELTCLLGLNGAGKSTLLRTLSGMQPSLDGEVLLYGKNINNYKEDELSKILGLVLTDKTSVGGLTVKQLVGLGRYPYTGFFGRLTKTDYEVIDNAMEDVGISHKSNAYMAELSDGERQKAMIAKSLAQECPIVFLDEPTAFLDVASRIEIMNLLHNLAASAKKTILLSTHDMDLAFLLADRLWLLSRIKGMKCGVTEDLILDNTVKEFFDREGISFDKKTGNFLPIQNPERTIQLNVDENLRHWVENFLRRKNIGIEPNISTSNLPLIDVKGYNNIEFINNSKTEKFKSFEELLSVL
ncbi:ABC transporter ATP-binding protein [Dysgonomonas sp. 216]|uniref:ABC transporter ATP-binding protein n=1 Tax=Dysgonomonas sp. 216 TaxID=2302934 RepID=UPI0013D84F47|nr:ABC transporter ATP-binding protein [Dysgonomonas sp. 216]NDW18044.1 ABC transporter ATP-binding protein [Dysgonomonas sp. 216]